MGNCLLCWSFASLTLLALHRLLWLEISFYCNLLLHKLFASCSHRSVHLSESTPPRKPRTKQRRRKHPEGGQFGLIRLALLVHQEARQKHKKTSNAWRPLLSGWRPSLVAHSKDFTTASEICVCVRKADRRRIEGGHAIGRFEEEPAKQGPKAKGGGI